MCLRIVLSTFGYFWGFPFLYDLVFGRYREHPDSDLDDSGSVAIVGKRATSPWPVCECFSFINYIFIMYSKSDYCIMIGKSLKLLFIKNVLILIIIVSYKCHCGDIPVIST